MTRATVRRTAVTLAAALLATLAVALLISTSAVAGGGLSVNNPKSGKPDKAKLLKSGRAVPPENAPRRVVKAIRAANKIRKTRYVWGGGHGDFKDNGYDCSGAVSFMLHGGRMLKTPMTSGSLAHWGRKGKGKWISVYANSGHVYAMVAGLRWDTSGGPGPRWHKSKRSRAGFKVRHYKSL
jgi:cell wall-associated NlpC family hydrolase